MVIFTSPSLPALRSALRYSRYIVSWELSETLEIDFVLTYVDRALSKAAPKILNSDHDSNFTSPRFVDRVLAAGSKVIWMVVDMRLIIYLLERLWRTIKYDHVYHNEYAAPGEARQEIGKYLLSIAMAGRINRWIIGDL